MHVTLTDEEELLDAVGRVRAVYPNLMKLDFDNRRTRAAGGQTAAAEVERKSLPQLFDEFFELMNGGGMSDGQRALFEAALRASGIAVDDAILRAGIRDAMLPGRFQIISDAPRVILDVAHNPHAAAYLAGRLKTLAKTGRVLAVIGMLHDKDIAGTLANLAPEVDAWYCAPLEGPRGATAEQLVEHLRGGTVYSSVAQAWQAAMADAKVEDTVLVCGSFHTVAQVMEEIDAGRIGGE